MPHYPLHNKDMPMASIKSGDLFEVLPDAAGLTVKIVNVCFVSLSNSSDWVLVDAGMPNSKELIAEAEASRFGRNVRPKVILVTHGHIDHAGSAVD